MNDPTQGFVMDFDRPENGTVGWHEPGESVGGQWEEPQWDEPRQPEQAHAAHSSERLTPARLRAVVFRRAPLGRRGLDEDQVNNLLDRVEEELTLLTQEKKALEEEVALLRKRLSDLPAATPPQPSPEQAEQAEPRRREIQRAEPADHIQSQTVAGRVHEAHVYAATLLAQAQQTADQYIQDARRYSRELIEDARRQRSELLAKAGEGPSGETWEREAARLRADIQRYRSKLRDHVELLRADLDEWEAAEEIAPPAPSTELTH